MTITDVLAARYAAYLTAQLNGDEIETIDFGVWLDAHWHEGSDLPIPDCQDDVDGSRVGNAITWIEHEGALLGLLAGQPLGCYRIAVTELVPPVAIYLDDHDGCSTGSSLQERGRPTPCDTFEIDADTRIDNRWLFRHVPSVEPVVERPFGPVPNPPVFTDHGASSSM